MDDKWVDRNDLLIRIPQEHVSEPPFLFYNKIAGFNFDGTLIKPKTGTTYNSLNDWQVWGQEVIPKLIELHTKKYSIVVLGNQIEIAKGKVSKEDLTRRFNGFYDMLLRENIPIIGIFSLKNNVCHKPYTGMWKILELLYEKNRFEKPDRKKSIFVGNLAGRKSVNKSYKYPKRLADGSYVDRAFAYNLAVKFHTPEWYFLGEKNVRPFKYNKNALDKEDRLKIQLESEDMNNKNPFRHGVRHFLKKTFGDIKQFLIITVGPPTSSKTSLTNYIIDQTRIHVIDRKIEPWTVLDPSTFSKIGKYSIKKCAKKISEEITHGNSVIVDGNNASVDCRSAYIEVVKQFDSVGILIIEMCIPASIAKHLNHMRIEMSDDFDLAPTNNNTFIRYSKKFQSPTDEEFGNIGERRRKIIGYPFLLVNVKEFWFIF